MANEFSRSIFPPELLNGEKSNTVQDTFFSLTGKFDGTNQLTAVVGVYETCDKKKGNFLLFFKTNPQSEPLVVTLVSYGQAEFSYLYAPSNKGIRVAHCYACDVTEGFQWNVATHQFELVPEEDNGD